MHNVRRLVVVPLACVALASCGTDDAQTGASPPNAQAGTTAATTVVPPATLPATVPTPTAPSTAPPASTAAPTAPTAPATLPAAGPIELIVDVDDPSGQGQVQPVPLGRDVVLRMTSGVDREYHVHGFDVDAEVAAGTEWTFEFTADQPGRFEIEDHMTDTLLLVLEVA